MVTFQTNLQQQIYTVDPRRFNGWTWAPCQPEPQRDEPKPNSRESFTWIILKTHSLFDLGLPGKILKPSGHQGRTSNHPHLYPPLPIFPLRHLLVPGRVTMDGPMVWLDQPRLGKKICATRQNGSYGWWLNHPSEKYARQMGNLPQTGVIFFFSKYLSCHHPVVFFAGGSRFNRDS